MLYVFLWRSSGSSCATCGRRRASRSRPSAGWSSSARSRRAGIGATFALDAVTTLGRDVNNSIVVDDPFVVDRARRPDVSGPGLVRRGPRLHERDVRQRRPVDGLADRSPSATRSRSVGSASGSSGRARADDRRQPGAGRRAVGAIRPRFRRRELGPARARRPRPGRGQRVARDDAVGRWPVTVWPSRPADPGRLLVYLMALFGAASRPGPGRAGGPTRSSCRPSACSAASACC